MQRSYAKSPNSALARALIEDLQALFVGKLDALSSKHGESEKLQRVEWLRDEGRHGGGNRYVAVENSIFNRAAVNVSGIHYDDEKTRKLASADALSTIIHPCNPRAPSVHMHFSWTEMRDGAGYFRLMADLNPCIEEAQATFAFEDALRKAAPEHYGSAAKQGDRYFAIPALDRHRGVTHFYLEGFSTGNFERDAALTRTVGEAAINSYIEILGQALDKHQEVSDADKQTQLAYHTAYLFQVLTLDRGTTSGLLVHTQNDQGIMGSLPAYVDARLLNSWAEKVEAPQNELVRSLARVLGLETRSHVTAERRLELAEVVRAHYKKYPDALDLQAKGNIVPPTVANHL